MSTRGGTKKDLLKTIEHLTEMVNLDKNAFRVIYETCISADVAELKLQIIKPLAEIHKRG